LVDVRGEARARRSHPSAQRPHRKRNVGRIRTASCVTQLFTLPSSPFSVRLQFQSSVLRSGFYVRCSRSEHRNRTGSEHGTEREDEHGTEREDERGTEHESEHERRTEKTEG